MDCFNEYKWHSSLELGSSIKGKKIIRKLTASKKNADKFLRIASNSNFCIHKSTKELWQFSDDGKYIVAVFPDDVITEDNL